MYFVRAELEHLCEIFSKFLGVQSMMWNNGYHYH